MIPPFLVIVRIPHSRVSFGLGARSVPVAYFRCTNVAVNTSSRGLHMQQYYDYQQRLRELVRIGMMPNPQ
jgi:hypothetical protein